MTWSDAVLDDEGITRAHASGCRWRDGRPIPAIGRLAASTARPGCTTAAGGARSRRHSAEPAMLPAGSLQPPAAARHATGEGCTASPRHALISAEHTP